MSLSEFIYEELVGDGYIDAEDYDASDITRDMLMQETDLEETDIDDLVNQYREKCAEDGVEPNEDI